MLVSYDMNRLQRLAEPDDHVVTLNGDGPGRPARRSLATMQYAHPVYTRASVAAQRRLPELNDGTVAFAGAYHGWGFHEDGCAAGRAGRRRVSGWTGDARCRDHRRSSVRLYDATSPTPAGRPLRPVLPPPQLPVAGRPRRAARAAAVAAAVRPVRGARPPRRTRGRSIRRNLDRWLAAHGVDLHGGRVVMLAQARVLGYVFNPLTVYWCHGPDGALACVVAEVHNTYGERHCYLLRPDAAGRARTAQGVLRLAVPPGRRQLRDGAAGAGRAAARSR